MVNKVTFMVYEIIEKVAAAQKREDKINILRQYHNNWALKDILRGTYDDKIQWNLPGGKPPFDPADEQTHPSSLTQHNKKFMYFVKGLQGDQMTAVKREKIFLDIIETVHPKDAELMLGMINKKSIKGVTKKIVEEAFPDLIVSK
tara:strand:+ start:56 stop:490 length:435 start_codon:yes stop_codon:yes gene_type:complete